MILNTANNLVVLFLFRVSVFFFPLSLLLSRFRFYSTAFFSRCTHRIGTLRTKLLLFINKNEMQSMFHGIIAVFFFIAQTLECNLDAAQKRDCTKR